MTEILTALQPVATPTQVSGRGDEHRPSEAARGGAGAPAPASFAAVLKSKSAEVPPESGKESSPVADSEMATDISDTQVVTDPMVLLSMFRTDSPLFVNPAPPTVAPVATSDKLAVEVAIVATPSGADSRAASSISALLVPATGASSPALANMPAPTLSSEAQDDIPEGTFMGAVGRATVHSSVLDKLSSETAITATPAMTTVTSTSHDPKEGESRVNSDRPPHHPVEVVMLVNRTSESTARSAELHLETPLGHNGWREEVGQKLTWMVSNNRQQADLVLSPSHLGRIEVTLTLDGDRASVSFGTLNPAVRETLESSMVRLREVLAEAGIALGQTHVGADSRHGSNSTNEKSDGFSAVHTAAEHHLAAFNSSSGSFAWVSGVGGGIVDVFV